MTEDVTLESRDGWEGEEAEADGSEGGGDMDRLRDDAGRDRLGFLKKETTVFVDVEASGWSDIVG